MGRMSRLVRQLALAALLALSVACTAHLGGVGGGKTQDAPLADDLEGAEVARHLNKRYAESVSNCSGGPRMPAFLCSGIILRAAKYSPNYHAWVPNPNDPNGDGVSFSFLRHDAKFKALAYGYQQGFIAYPVAYTPPSLIHLQVLCGFPLDAATDIRSDSGCGPSDRYPNQSGPCQAQAIFTAPQWITHYRTAVEEPHRFQCGFTLAAGTANSAAIFMEMLESMHELGEESFNVQNELIIRSWAATPNQIPIEAFFYVGGTQGLGAAQNIQRDFSQTVDAWRPVIRMNLPATSTGSVTFEYVPGEQAVR